MKPERLMSISEPSAKGHGGILIVGLAHSGKTEVRRILDTSSRIRSARRVRQWPHIADVTPGTTTAAEIEAYVTTVRRDETVSSWDLDVDAVVAGWRALEEPTFSGLLALLHQQHATRHGADIWCAQINQMEPVIERLLFELPGIRIIHTIRDPRDGLGVARRSGLVGRRGWDLASWARSAHVAVASRNRHPSRYLVVRWEDLVDSPDVVSETIGEFIGTDVTVPADWNLTRKPIGRGIRGKRIHGEISSLLDSLEYVDRPGDDSSALGTDSAISDVVDLVCYRIRSRRLHRTIPRYRP